MPKMKSRRGAVKRFKVTGKGKIKRSRAYKSHLLSSKKRKQKRRLRKSTVVSPTEGKNISRLIPYL